MKLTAKLAKHGFDSKYFFETIDYQGQGKIKFVACLATLKERFELHLSSDDIETFFLYIRGEIL